MNLLDKSIRQLAVLAVALFFFSCEDETSLLGFRSPNKKFSVNYVEIPVTSTVLLVDSLRTSNYYTSSETNRLLVGKYTDPRFGEIASTAYTQFFTTNTSKTLLKESAQLDSVSIDLRFDYYTYGGNGASAQTIAIHEVTEDMPVENRAYFFNKTNVAFNPTPLGSKTFVVDPSLFEKIIDDRKDTTITVRVLLAKEFGDRIFASAHQYRQSATAADSTFARYSEFVKQFKGIAIVATDGDKVMGFNPTAAASRITLHYHDADTDSLQLNLSFSGTLSYNKINANTGSTELAGLTAYHQDFLPGSGLRYIQAGTGIVTKLDLGKFYDFADADSNASIIVNSAELRIEATDPTDFYAPVSEVSLLVNNDDFTFRKLTDREKDFAQHAADSVALVRYANFLVTNENGHFTPLGEEATIFTMRKAEDANFYSGFLTRFVQQMFYKSPDKPRFRYFTLYPAIPAAHKSVNRLVFHKDAIKFRIYYTRPADLSTP